MYLCSKRASKMLLSFSIGTFSTNYDITNRKLHCMKTNKMREKYSNWFGICQNLKAGSRYKNSKADTILPYRH